MRSADAIAIDPISHNIFVVDCLGERVMIFDSAGQFQSVFGTPESDPGQFGFGTFPRRTSRPVLCRHAGDHNSPYGARSFANGLAYPRPTAESGPDIIDAGHQLVRGRPRNEVGWPRLAVSLGSRRLEHDARGRVRVAID